MHTDKERSKKKKGNASEGALRRPPVRRAAGQKPKQVAKTENPRGKTSKNLQNNGVFPQAA